MMGPLISVVIPAYNQGAFIDEAISSVLNQQYKNLEIIVVDDGSTDNTKHILEKYQGKITCISQDNQGASGARNSGLRVANGEYIAFLDADDTWIPEKLNLQLTTIRDDSSIGMVGCGYYVVNNSGNIIKEWIPRNYDDENDFFRELAVRNIFGNPSAAFIRKECFEKVGLFNQNLRFGEDWDMWLKIASCYRVRIIEKPLVKFRKLYSYKTYKKLEIIKSNVKWIVENHVRPCEREIRRKAYSFLYTDLARLCLSNNKKASALGYIFKSFLAYPFKISAEDLKYVMVARCLIPNVIRKRK